MTICYLALGSNLRTPERQLRQAIGALHALPKTYILSVANFYKNPAVGRKTQPLFFNTVIAIHTALEPKFLLAECLKIENHQGRVRRVKNGARTLDIDILLYGKKRIHTADLTIPHPAMFSRDFVMIPLQELLTIQPLCHYTLKSAPKGSKGENHVSKHSVCL
jgi:2-amino-4-hydroxy-6-hydroxymethyldihydropteridine diphosphokinase